VAEQGFKPRLTPELSLKAVLFQGTHKKMGGGDFKSKKRGAWVSQSVECPTLDRGLGLELTVMSSSPSLGSSQIH